MTISAGDPILVEHFVDNGDYTPQLLASTTNPILGSTGEALGRWWRDPITGRVWGEIFISFGGSGVSAGSGTYSVTLPTAADGFESGSTGQADIWGWFTIRDDSNTDASRLGYLTRNTVSGGPGGVAVADLAILDGTQAFVDNDYPWVWAAGDAIACRFDYMSPV